MKDLMDFCIGTVVFMLLGYGIMIGENDFFGLIGMPEQRLFTAHPAACWRFQIKTGPSRLGTALQRAERRWS